MKGPASVQSAPRNAPKPCWSKTYYIDKLKHPQRYSASHAGLFEMVNSRTVAYGHAGSLCPKGSHIHRIRIQWPFGHMSFLGPRRTQTGQVGVLLTHTASTSDKAPSTAFKQTDGHCWATERTTKQVLFFCLCCLGASRGSGCNLDLSRLGIYVSCHPHLHAYDLEAGETPNTSKHISPCLADCPEKIEQSQTSWTELTRVGVGC